uniref:LITAF domain-containing protein n=1 Tax=Syphacia muris TaxID=451379 RepID=A0A0N5APK9_9BILA
MHSVTLQIRIVNANVLDFSNHLYITKNIVCEQLLNNSVAVILWHYNDNDISLLSTAAYALSFYHIPTIGINIRSSAFSQSKYQTFLRTSPPYSYEALVALYALEALGFRESVVVYVKDDIDALDFVVSFQNNLASFKINVQKYIEIDMRTDFNETVAGQFEEVTSNIIILFAKTDDAEQIFDILPIFSTAGKMCIVNELASYAPNVPTGTLSMRLSQDALSLLQNVLTTLGYRIRFFSNIEAVPPSNCPFLKTDDNKWISETGMKFYKELLLRNSEDEHSIEFDESGNCISAPFEITNIVDGEIRRIGSIDENHRIRLNEQKITWIGGGKKPQGITLPKHLRVVTTYDPPFVYTVPATEASECDTLGTKRIEEVEVYEFFRIGPWYPCVLNLNATTVIYCCAGYAIDLVSNLSLSEEAYHNDSVHTGFTFEIHLNESYGMVFLSDDGYVLSGMVGELDAETADLAVGGLTINPEREQYIDFSEPWLYHGIRILEKWRSRDSPMESFLQPMKTSLWGALLASVLIVGCVIYLLDLYSPFDRFSIVAEGESSLNLSGTLFHENPNERVNFGEAMWFVWGVLLNSGVCEKTPRSCSARVLGVVWCGFCMIMVASYTANLAAFLVLDQPEKGLTGITDPRLRNPAANFTFGTVLDTNTYQYFKRHIELSTMHRNMEPHNVRTASQAIQRLLNGTLDAFIWDSTRLEFEASRNCELRTRGTLFGRSAYGVGLQKNSPWTPHITNAILRLAENGKMEQLHSKWIISTKPTPCLPVEQKVPARLGFTNMRDVFVLVSGGIIVGVVLSSIEVSVGRRRITLIKRKALAQKYAKKWRVIAEERKLVSLSTSISSNDSFHCKHSECQIHLQRYNSQQFSMANDASKKAVASKSVQSATMQRTHRRKLIQTDLNFQEKSVRVFCSRCRSLVETRTYPVMGCFAYILAFIFITLFLWPCVPIACFLPCFADYVHICPNCGHRVGRYRRGAKPKFYV